MEHVLLEVPSLEVSFLRTLSKKMGWTMKRQRKAAVGRAESGAGINSSGREQTLPKVKSGLQQALEDVEAGRVYEAKSVEDLMAQLEA